MNISSEYQKLIDRIIDDKLDGKTQIWFCLADFLIDIRNYIGALKAMNNVIANSNNLTDNNFIKISQEGIEHALFLEIAKIFDTEETCKHVNCSIRTLQKKLKSDSDSEETREFAKDIYDLYENYKNIIPISIRNKKIAHHDLNDLLSVNHKEVGIDAMDALIEDTGKLLVQIGNSITLIEYPYLNVPKEDIVNKYVFSFMKLRENKI